MAPATDAAFVLRAAQAKLPALEEAPNCGEASESLASLASLTTRSTGASSVRSLKAPLEDAYDVLVTLGQGRFGAVREVARKGSKERYAVKVMDCGRDSASEFKILAELRHQNIVKLHEAREHDGLAYLVMDLCAGGTLMQWMQDRFQKNVGKAVYLTPPPKLLGNCLWQILDAVRYLHSYSIAHRDIKPQNLLLAKGGPHLALKLADFNLATEVHGEFLKKCCGTPGFMAPEVVRCHYTELCDVWSAGVVFYQMATGLRLWRDANSKEEHFSQLLAETPVTLPRTPVWKSHGEGARDLATELLSLESQGRPTAAAAMESPWLQKQVLGVDKGCCAIS